MILTVFGDSLSPEKLNELLNISPTSTWKKGDKIVGRNNLFRKESAWSYETDFVQTLYLQEVGEQFINVFDSGIYELKNFIEQNQLEAKIYIVIEIFNEEKPALYFNKELLAMINTLNAEIDMDMYMY